MFLRSIRVSDSGEVLLNIIRYGFGIKSVWQI